MIIKESDIIFDKIWEHIINDNDADIQSRWEEYFKALAKEEKYYLSRKGNVLRIICKDQEPLRPWTLAEVQDAIEYAKSKKVKHLIIDGDDSNINRNDNKTLIKAGFRHWNTTKEGRKLWLLDI